MLYLFTFGNFFSILQMHYLYYIFRSSWKLFSLFYSCKVGNLDNLSEILPPSGNWDGVGKAPLMANEMFVMQYLAIRF